MELLRPILELGVVIPGMLLAYFPAKSSLKQPLSKLVLWLVPLLALLCAAGGVVCYARRMPTAPVLAGLTLLAAVIYIKTLRISLWKSGTVALSVCAVFACINSLCRAINAAMLIDSPQAQAAPWFCLRSAICYHAICWLFAAIAYDRSLTTTSGDVTLHMPRLKGVSFETAIIERYRRRESSVEEALIEMYLAGVSVRRVTERFATSRYYCLMPVHARGGLTVTPQQ